MFENLHKFVDSLVDLFPTLMWIFTVLLLFCYVNAVVLTHLFGRFEALDDEHMSKEDMESVKHYFGDVITSMFTLFQILTLDSWHKIAQPVVSYMPIWRLFFVFFIAFGSWTMISLLTAVVSDNMIAATADLKEVEAKRAYDTKMEFIGYLQASFHDVDADHNGKLDRSEFIRWIDEVSTMQQLHKAGINLRKDELISLFDMLDFDDSHTLSIDEFVGGLARAQDPVGMKHVLLLEHLFTRLDHKVSKNHKRATEIAASVKKPSLTHRLDRLATQVQEVVDQHRSVVQEQGKISSALLELQGAVAAALSVTGAQASPTRAGRRAPSISLWRERTQ